MPEAASALLALGSDDGVRVWLNGEKVHDHWGCVGRDRCGSGAPPVEEGPIGSF